MQQHDPAGSGDAHGDDSGIGVQRPRRRITSPQEALAELERAVPGLVEHRRTRRAHVDWALVEQGLGTALPPDFRLLAEWYATFALDDFLLVGLPEPGTEPADVRRVREALEVIADTWAEPRLGLVAFPSPGGLLPWGESCDGDKFLWSTGGSGPEAWRVTVGSRGGSWWHYEGGMVQFLAELCGGALGFWGLPVIHPQVTPC